ncbi:MAG TPA: hypothetical protein VNK52_00225 [Hyphomicrobiaceae bacterium]|nr:hypothetical protein [Hyphomicrobiaceae bacterium]
MAKAHTIAFLSLGAAAVVTGCAGGPTLPGPPPAQSAALDVATTEAYTRIAQAAMSCWFGPQGRLTGRYLFHADAEPPSRGGGVEIVIHERAVDQPKPWGPKAFRITLTGGGGYTAIDVENLRMPAPLAAEMRMQALSWARGTSTCTSKDVAALVGGHPPTSVTGALPAPHN